MTMRGGDLNPDRFCGKLKEVPMSSQISITLGEEKISVTLNAHYINSWKFWIFLIVFFFFLLLNAIKLLPYSLNEESLIFP